jgi:hypothetical protein
MKKQMVGKIPVGEKIREPRKLFRKEMTDSETDRDK